MEATVLDFGVLVVLPKIVLRASRSSKGRFESSVQINIVVQGCGKSTSLEDLLGPIDDLKSAMSGSISGRWGSYSISRSLSCKMITAPVPSPSLEKVLLYGTGSSRQIVFDST